MVRYNFDPDAPVITVYASLSNSRTRRILTALDTGVTYVLIPWDIAEALGYEPAYSNRKVAITTASGTEKAPLITVRCVRVLGKEMKDVACIVHDLPETSRVDGLLGLSFLKGFKLYLDFQAGILELE